MQPFRYQRAASVAQAIEAWRAGAPHSCYLAGGTTLVDLMRAGAVAPASLIDVSAIPGLDGIAVSREGELHLGAMARMHAVADHPEVRSRYPVLAESLALAASAQLRNMATLGGNLLQRTRCAYFRSPEFPCNKREPGTGCSARGGLDRGHAVLGVSEACRAVYPGDLAIALAALDAWIDLHGPLGRRSIRLADLHRSPGKAAHVETVLAPGELIVRIRVPADAPVGASAYLKVRDRASFSFALASAAVALRLHDGRVADVRIALGGVATRPWRAREAERWLRDRRLEEASARAAAEAAFAGATVGSHNGYKVRLGIDTVVEALMVARNRTTS
ncbi:xanthine dehydrogenase family protein subunit M [Cupriavidus sp. AU9028]|uniref:FAD binding domain-containing protein n=1 Tax=Cupriavidus sp. AU9028 TaxID=2871157 RepID=UPI001C967DFD|nr:FAD binding domain-containing protein [Cupriavidus sp. AU9028]MBY4895988.1 FAD binding domain-containing protein [Cupriavidus sp. AU9028]